MQTNLFHGDDRFHAIELAINAIAVLRPTVERIRCCDRELADQLRAALRSMAMHIAEGNRSRGGYRTARFRMAAGSNSESRAAVRVAVSWGYVPASEVKAGDEVLDRIGSTLHRLSAPR
ncbi:four helix bundle protein [Pendulispora rubella]|uniref:Four helix bundle protein n=1 Tax=Pendulispora rubella TaxID=2741070 RepID=A0ABZ2LHZ2_9BACT